MLSPGMPWTIAGLTMGAWSVEDPFTVAAVPPGIPEAQAPLAWYDSTRIVMGEGAAWRGFGAPVASAEGSLRPPGGSKPRAVYSMASGDGGLERNGILVSRGDERSWLHAGAVAGKRSGSGAMGPAGDHLWAVTSGARRGDHIFSGSFSQRGLGESLRNSDATFGETARGTGGRLGWEWSREGRRAGLSLERSQDIRTSFAPYFPSLYSRRDAWRNGATLTLGREIGTRSLDWKLSWSESYARRVFLSSLDWEAWDHTAWSAVRVKSPLAGGTAEAALGGGFDGAMARKSERWQLAPSFVWRREWDATRVRLFGERTLNPVWADLTVPALQAPFMQDCWVGGAEAGRGAMVASVMGGRVGGRATLLRYPIRDVPLRGLSWQADPSAYGFLLAQASGDWNWRVLGADARGYLLARDASPRQPNVDPGVGGAFGISSAYRLFGGDIGGRMRLEAAWVGERHTDARDSRFEDIPLAGYATFAASASAKVGDVTLLFRLDGLEQEPHPQTWLDPAFDEPTLARDSGRRFRFELSWPLFN